jgi:hypothetical protein
MNRIQPAKEFEPSAQAIRSWVAQADHDEGRRESDRSGVQMIGVGRAGRTLEEPAMLSGLSGSRFEVG